jgi:hypothetical protein
MQATTTTTTEKRKKPFGQMTAAELIVGFDQITQQEKIEVGQAIIKLFAYAGIFKSIDSDKDQLWGEKECSLICELIGHSYLTYLRFGIKTMPIDFWAKHIEQAYFNGFDIWANSMGTAEENDQDMTIVGQFSKQLDLFNEFLNRQ